MRSLPETFQLPTSRDIEQIVQSIDAEAKYEGSIGVVLKEYRAARKDSHAFEISVLRPLSKLAVLFEGRDEGKQLIDQKHRLANAAMSGMLFGNMVNEQLYPAFNVGYFPYVIMGVNKNYLSPHDVFQFEKLGSGDTGEGRRMGYYAMSALQIENFTDETLTTVNEWGDVLIPEAAYRENFLKGFGVAAYAAWDIYSDHMEAEGLPYATPRFYDHNTQPNGGP